MNTKTLDLVVFLFKTNSYGEEEQSVSNLKIFCHKKIYTNDPIILNVPKGTTDE